jgi:hypothetical protein
MPKIRYERFSTKHHYGSELMLQPENQSKKYEALFADIDSGKMKIPLFQRDFVWTKEQTANLIDSIIKGFPIGTFILWKTNEEMRAVRDIGNVRLPEIPKGDSASYVLDGQQRITSLYAVRKGVVFKKEGQEIDYNQITINLSMDPDADEQVVGTEPPDGEPHIPVHRLLTGTITEFATNYAPYLELIDTYRSRLTGYNFSVIVIPEYPIDVACEIFTRINTGGTELTLFEIMVAKTYDNERGFDLAERYQHLIDNNGKSKDLEDADFDTIPASTVLQCVSACLSKQIRRKDILKLNKEDFIQAWPEVTDSIFAAVDFIRTALRIPVSQLLPYNALLVLFTYFFYQNHGQPPTHIQSDLLVQFFWWASLSGRYSAGADTKVGQDLLRIDRILNEEQPSYRGEEVQLTMDQLRYKWFSTGDAFCKAILCLYAYHSPRSFNNDNPVKIDNSWLRTSISKNYHHFFPRAYLRNQGVPDWQANSILNITIVDDHLNKRAIRAKPPKEYMRSFKKTNRKLADTMATHLIDDLDEFGVWENDYERFLELRGQRVIEELNKRLNPE